MPHFREVTPNFAVSPQISPEDVAQAKQSGFTLIINNRPDGESPDQPAGSEIEAAARSVGLDYLFIPVVGRPTAAQAAAVSRALAASKGKALAYCRTGNRSIITWALGELAAGRDRGDILRLAATAGYDLSAVLCSLSQRLRSFDAADAGGWAKAHLVTLDLRLPSPSRTSSCTFAWRPVGCQWAYRSCRRFCPRGSPWP